MPYSAYNYILPSELPTYIHTMASVTSESIAAKFITDAERVIDAYVGPGPRFYSDLTGAATVAASGTTLSGTIFGERRPNYWARGGLYIEMLDGASGLEGESRLVVASTDNAVTLATAFSSEVPSGATFLVTQESAFPRLCDQDPLATPRLPDELKMAVAFQVEYGIQFGSEEFGLGTSDIADGEAGLVQSRTYGSGYTESRAVNTKQGLAYFLAPKARYALRNLLNSTGRLR